MSFIRSLEKTAVTAKFINNALENGFISRITKARKLGKGKEFTDSVEKLTLDRSPERDNVIRKMQHEAVKNTKDSWRTNLEDFERNSIRRTVSKFNKATKHY